MVVLFGSYDETLTGRERAHALLTRAVRDVWSWEELPPMARGERGKPYFPGAPGRWFNLSHSDPWALCALSDEGEVGVDVEMVRPHRAGLPRYVMSDGELAGFDGSWEDFARVWTLKEAYAKYLGRAVWPPRSIPVPPPVGYRTYAGDTWRAALCGEGDLPERIVWL